MVLDMSALNNEKESVFNVYIKDMGGQTVKVLCTPDTTVSYLINKFRDNISPFYKRHIILLFNETSPVKLNGTPNPLDVMGTLKSNGIKPDTELFAKYNGIKTCINSEPIAQHLHPWIQNEGTTFLSKFRVAKNPTVRNYDCTDLLTELNNWNKGEEYVFFLTETRSPHFKTWTSDDINMPKSKEVKSYDGPIDYISGLSKRNNISMYYEYYPNGPGRLHQAPSTNMVSIRGTLDKITINITQSKQSNADAGYKREFKIYVNLKGPIEIRKANGTIEYSSNDPDAVCNVPYDSIMMCDIQGQLNKPIKSLGGKRTKRTRTKRTRTKRTRTKRKAHRRTHKNRA